MKRVTGPFDENVDSILIVHKFCTKMQNLL
jgi:hypothetical protein